MKVALNKYLKYIFIFFALIIATVAIAMLKTPNHQTPPLTSDTSVKPHVNSSEQSVDTLADKTKVVSMDVAALKNQQSELSQQIKLFQQQLDDIAAQSMANTANHETADQQDDRFAGAESDIEEEELARAILLDQIDLMENTLVAETPDAEWSHNAVSTLNQAMDSELNTQNMELLDVDCRSTMCRMNIAFNPEAVEDGFNNLQDIIPWNGEMFFQVEDINSGEATVYVARENYELPKL